MVAVRIIIFLVLPGLVFSSRSKAGGHKTPQAEYSAETSKKAEKLLRSNEDPIELEITNDLTILPIAGNLVFSAAVDCTSQESCENVVFANSFSEAISLHILAWEKNAAASEGIKNVFRLNHDASDQVFQSIKRLSTLQLFREIKRFKSSRLFRPLHVEGHETALPVRNFLEALEMIFSPNTCKHAAEDLKQLSENVPARRKFMNVLDKERGYVCALNLWDDYRTTRSAFIEELHKIDRTFLFPIALSYLEHDIDEKSRQELFHTTGFDEALDNENESEFVKFLLVHGSSKNSFAYAQMAISISENDLIHVLDHIFQICAGNSDTVNLECLGKFASRNFMGTIALLKSSFECAFIQSLLDSPIEIDLCEKLKKLDIKELVTQFATRN